MYDQILDLEIDLHFLINYLPKTLLKGFLYSS
jgi:hypothetical protein